MINLGWNVHKDGSVTAKLAPTRVTLVFSKFDQAITNRGHKSNLRTIDQISARTNILSIYQPRFSHREKRTFFHKEVVQLASRQQVNISLQHIGTDAEQGLAPVLL